MKYIVRGEKLEVTDSIKGYVEDKLSKLDKYFDNADSITANVLIKVKNREQKVEVTIDTKMFQLRAEESHADLYAAIDLVSDKVERQIRKNKTKLQNKYSSSAEIMFNYIEDEEVEEDLVKKRKHVELKPMDEEEAILQMELSDHDFYIFKNIETESICVIYKRKDGYYGLMDTEN